MAMLRTFVIVLLAAGTAAGCGDDTEVPTEDSGPGDGGAEGGAPDAGFDAGSDAGPACPAPTSGPTVHMSGSVPADETWTADTGPHIVPVGTTVAATATLTIEACAEVRIGAGVTVTVRGALVADGRPGQRVLITSDGTAPFATIRNFGGTSSIRLAHTTVENGGDPLTTELHLAAAVVVTGVQTDPTQGLLHVDNVTVTGSLSNGILLRESAGFTSGSTALTVTGSTLHPVSLGAPDVGTLPDGDYTGNAIDEILVPGQVIVRDAAIHDRGVAYRIGSPTTSAEIVVDAGDTGLATLTIDPGVTLRFSADGALWAERATGRLESNGALVAVGTAADPIVFTSAADPPAAGDWLGVYFASTPRPTTRLDHVVVEYAGGNGVFGSEACLRPGDPESDAAIRVMSGEPPAEFVTNSTIAHSALDAIDRGWAGSPVDFLATNTFMDIARCRQSYPRPGSGPCPDPPPCD
jgi:hypothetical protein